VLAVVDAVADHLHAGQIERGDIALVDVEMAWVALFQREVVLRRQHDLVLAVRPEPRLHPLKDLLAANAEPLDVLG
jgi:hypothetical protein